MSYDISLLMWMLLGTSLVDMENIQVYWWKLCCEDTNTYYFSLLIGGGPKPKEPCENYVKIVETIVTPAKVVGISGGVDTLTSNDATIEDR